MLRTIFLLLGVFSMLPGLALAEMPCNGCHGMPPIDSPYRNYSTGGVPGNHQKHITASPVFATNCNRCHPGTDSYAARHQDRKVKVSASFLYGGYTSAQPFTASPTLSSCNNVNCHFEKQTPIWGSAVFSLTDCSACHNTTTLTSGTHSKHIAARGSTLTACSSCHPSHNTTSTPFAHATSVEYRPINVVFTGAPYGTENGYEGGRSTSQVLPSAVTPAQGTCSNIYCHSDGTKSTVVFTSSTTARWGGSLSCSSCHKGSISDSTSISTGSHTGHIKKTMSIWTLTTIPCSECHAITVDNTPSIIDSAKHVNGNIDIAFQGTTSAQVGGLKAPIQKVPGTVFTSCSNIYCHSNAQGINGNGPPSQYITPLWGSSTTGMCGTCHSVSDTTSATHGGFPAQGGRLTTGGHDKHLGYALVSTGAGKCLVCHAGTVDDFAPNTSCGSGYECHNDASVKHVNKEINVKIASYFGTTASYNGSTAPGDGYSTCANIYCHSDGTLISNGAAYTNITPNWGSTVALPCDSCHDYPPAYTNGSPKANSHVAHSSYTCDTCHNTVTTTGNTITNKLLHGNKSYNLCPKAGVTFTYTYNSMGGTCASVSCHTNNVGRQWGTP